MTGGVSICRITLLHLYWFWRILFNGNVHNYSACPVLRKRIWDELLSLNSTISSFEISRTLLLRLAVNLDAWQIHCHLRLNPGIAIVAWSHWLSMVEVFGKNSVRCRLIWVWYFEKTFHFLGIRFAQAAWSECLGASRRQSTRRHFQWQFTKALLMLLNQVNFMHAAYSSAFASTFSTILFYGQFRLALVSS